MPTSLIPANDAARLSALRRYELLDETNERIFDTLARVTARLFQTPIALLSLIEEEEVLFKGNYGLPGAERTGRNMSMCSVAILQDESTVFEDLDREPCQLTDPLLAQQLKLKFYAGHALKTTDGLRIGTLCIIDRKPRTFSQEEDALLTILANVAMRLLDLRLALADNATTSFRLWEPVYGAIHNLLTRLEKVADEAPVDSPALSPAVHKQVQDIATQLGQYIAAAMARV